MVGDSFLFSFCLCRSFDFQLIKQETFSRACIVRIVLDPPDLSFWGQAFRFSLPCRLGECKQRTVKIVILVLCILQMSVKEPVLLISWCSFNLPGKTAKENSNKLM
ncbi:uncharacterized protein LOC116210880 isoform X3 [Punica granatum]|uniref:Uncharacterized protein LOC116210880 isoform X3 n=1 Tax=Punica granatum TaxID=22663 RepID=A0A6P8E660_PUNGR|nr:uncharacterized protein LOC116210880 isoform X3 [Punica granatum]